MSVPINGTLFNGTQNDTVFETPMGMYLMNESEVLVVVHKSSSSNIPEPVTIQVVDNDYTVEVWGHSAGKFIDISNQTAYVEQYHR